MNLKSPCDDRSIKLIYMAVFAVSMLAAYCVFPYVLDDLWFRRPFAGYFDFPSFQTYWDGLKDSITVHYLFDNNRLFNTLASIIIVLPRCITGVICAFFAVAMCWLAARYAERRGLFYFALLQAGLVFVLPWYDSMFVVMYAFNYIGVSAVFLLASMLFINRLKGGAVLLFFVGFCTGVCHEAFTVALTGGAALVFVAFRKWRTIRTLAFVAGLFLGLVYLLFLFPGSAHRFSETSAINTADYIRRFISLFRIEFMYTLPVWCLWALSAILFVVPSTRRRICRPRIVFLLGASLASWMPFAPVFFWRAAWPIWLCAVILSVMLMQIFLPRLSKSKFSCTASLVILGAIIAHMFVVDFYVLDIRRDYDRLSSCFVNAPAEGPVYAPLPDTAGQSLFTLGKVNKEILFIFQEPLTRLVPLDLQDFDPVKATDIGVDMPIWLYKGYMVAPDVFGDDDLFYSVVNFGARKSNGMLYAHHFSNPAGKFVYLSPWCYYIASRYGNPTRVELSPA